MFDEKVELAARWIPNGKVEWINPVLIELEPIIHRKIIAASTLLQTKKDKNKNIKIMLEAMDRAAGEKADIICFCKTLYNGGLGIPLENACETVPGILTDEISKKAMRYNMYAIVSLLEKENGNYYNTAVLIVRNGKIAGKYRKTHLPLFEAEEGIQPGDEYPVFDTDFGKIGMMVCWDQWFPEPARILRIKWAEVIFVPTIGYAPIQSQAKALDNGVHLVISGLDGPIPSRIINPDGEVVSCLQSSDEGICTWEIDLDKKYCQYWLSVGPALGEGASLFLKERRNDTYSLLLKDI